MILTFAIVLILTFSQASHNITLEEPKNVKTHFTDEQKEKFLKIISAYPQNDKATGLVERYASCLQKFDEAMDNPDKGCGWSSASSSNTCVSVGQPCKTDYRNFTDYLTDSMKTPKQENKGWGSTPGWNSSTGWSSNSSSSSSQSSTCCNEDICHNHRCCTPTPATSTHSVCSTDSDCCLYDKGKAVCDTVLGICLTPLGKSCSATSECYAGICEEFCCYSLGNCQRSDVKCSSNIECCGNGVCVDGACLGGPGDTCGGCDSSCNPPLPCTDGICCMQSGSCESDHTVCCPGYKCGPSGIAMALQCFPDAFMIL